jgi:tRNA-specific 2-thiouridylase
MVNYEGTNQFGESCSVPEYRDAVRVAASLGIPILKFDFTKEYKAQVLDYMFKEYEAGRTPNPDILCNKFVKFGAWLKKARELGFNYLATGHYAQIKTLKLKNIKIFQLMESKDKNKDQTYFLHQLTQGQLHHVLFPIGNYTKPEVRKLAKKFNLPVAEKEESMGICFIGEVSMKDFLQQRIKPKPGKIILSSGEIRGDHEGLPFYTIGQRHLGVEKNLFGTGSLGQTKPLFVVAKRLETNELVIGNEADPLLYSDEINVVEVNWISGQLPRFPLQCQVRLRHRQQLQKSVLYQNNKGFLQIKFAQAQRATTPGQFAVFYLQGVCLGGGVILN